MSNLTEFEQKRLENIAANRALLESLGLNEPMIPKPSPKPKAKAPRSTPSSSRGTKRKSLAISTDKNENGKTIDQSSDSPSTSARRSGRERKQAKHFELDILTNRDSDSPDRRTSASTSATSPMSSFLVDDDLNSNGQLLRRLDGPRLHNPKTFGSIPGIEVGKWWDSRMRCSQESCHAPVVAGISGNSELGCWSVALSGGYEDDIDLGEAFTFTGSGGRSLRGTAENRKNLRTAPQSFDQDFDHALNAALLKSSQTKKPIRTIRGFRGKSIYAPPEGYVYSGLYTVEKAWLEKGLSGFMICKFAFKRVPGQPPLPTYEAKETIPSHKSRNNSKSRNKTSKEKRLNKDEGDDDGQEDQDEDQEEVEVEGNGEENQDVEEEEEEKEELRSQIRIEIQPRIQKKGKGKGKEKEESRDELKEELKNGFSRRISSRCGEKKLEDEQDQEVDQEL